MGHRLSKTTIADGSNTAANVKKTKRSSDKITNSDNTSSSSSSSASSSALNLETSQSSGPTIKVITDSSQTVCLETTHSESSSSSNGSRQIIIKIQLLAKMEPGENDASSSTTTATTNTNTNTTTQRLETNTRGDIETNNNLNVERSNLTVNAISFQRNIPCDQGNEIKLNNLNGGSSKMYTHINNINNNNNNNNNFVSNFTLEENSDELRNEKNVQNLNILVQQMGNCQILNNNVNDSRQCSNNNNDSTNNRSSTSSSEFSDANTESLLEEKFSVTTNGATVPVCSEDCKVDDCSRRKKSTPLSAYSSKWVYCKCKGADVLKKIRPSSSKKQNQPPPSSASSIQIPELQPLAGALSNSNDLNRTQPLALWSHDGNDVIIPITSPQILVVQYPTASQVVTLSPIANLDQHALRLMTSDLTIPRTPESTSSMSVSPCSTNSSTTMPNGTIVHSQADFVHWLVPDLDKITKSTYYWGKMDRYEAERLLEGKPEGTFLLRDSAQEEYLFSVTFRKYGRSLHARIEHFNRQFSFDCHDPGVFTASTVTGLLEHYKDPTIVMFFEPMLTSPLHRNKPFSLQQLCRATINSRTTYDGISELEIPIRLKSYLKEYHCKQRVRTKSLDETFYNCA